MEFRREYEISEVIRKLSYELNRQVTYSITDIIVENDEIKEGIIIRFIKNGETERELFEIDRHITNKMLSEMVVPVKSYKDVWLGEVRINLCYIDEYSGE